MPGVSRTGQTKPGTVSRPVDLEFEVERHGLPSPRHMTYLRGGTVHQRRPAEGPRFGFRGPYGCIIGPSGLPRDSTP